MRRKRLPQAQKAQLLPFGRRKRRQGRGKGRPALAVLFLLFVGVAWLEWSVSQVFSVYGEHAATNAAQVVFTSALEKLCENEDFSKSVSLQTDKNGEVKSFSGNAALQNKVQASLARAMCEEFEQRDRASFSLPLGTLLGDSLSSGRGPSVTFYVALSGSPTVTLTDEFSEAGINQTYHTVTAHVTLALLVTVLGKTRQRTVTLAAPVSETVVVGEVPKVYAAF